jgi:hypothetical protein
MNCFSQLIISEIKNFFKLKTTSNLNLKLSSKLNTKIICRKIKYYLNFLIKFQSIDRKKVYKQTKN